jgi:FKBP-type peptidyl-prolyl cis-trans isomerase FkpA
MPRSRCARRRTTWIEPMKKPLLAWLTLAALSVAHAADKPAAPPASAAGTRDTSGMTDEQKTFYVLGQRVGYQLKAFTPSRAELAILQSGLSDAISGAKPAVDLDAYGARIQSLAQARRAGLTKQADAAGKAFAAKAAQEPGAVTTPSGLVFISLHDGTGERPAIADTVKVHYRGSLFDGTEFDSSYKRGAPAEFPLGGVIRCWGEAIPKMKVGGKARIVCPAAIAYGDSSPPQIPPGSTLNFEVELLGVTKANPGPTASAPK